MSKNNYRKISTNEVYIMNKEDYRKQIIEMVKKIDNSEWLHFIHRMIKNLIK